MLSQFILNKLVIRFDVVENNLSFACICIYENKYIYIDIKISICYYLNILVFILIEIVWLLFTSIAG